MTLFASLESRKFSTVLLILTVLFTSFFFWEAARRPLASPDEGRYSEIPREMIVTGDFTTPRLNTVKYFEKPPLFYWMQAASMMVLGPNNLSARLVNIVMAIGGCLITLAFGWYFLSPRIGILASFILASTLLYYGISRIVTLDMTVSTWITAAIFAMGYGLFKAREQKRRRWICLGHIFCALGVMTKGIIGVAIPGSIILLWIILHKRWKWIQEALHPLGIGLFLCIVIPWHALVSLKNPEFLSFYFIHEHIDRLFTQVHQRYQPAWFFFPIFFGGLFPWIGFFLGSLKENFRTLHHLLHTTEGAFLSLLGLSISIVFVLFSLSQSKLIPYILPMFPPSALWMAYFIDQKYAQIAAQKETPQAFFWPYALNFLIAVALAIAICLVALPDHTINIVQDVDRWTCAFLIFCSGSLPWALYILRQRELSILAIVISAALAHLSINHLSVHLQRPSTQEIASVIKKHIPLSIPVICFEFYPQELPFYLERPVMISGWAGELSFGLSVEDKSSLIFDHAQTQRIWNSHDQVIIFVKKDTLESFKKTVNTPFHIVRQHLNILMLSKKPMDIG